MSIFPHGLALDEVRAAIAYQNALLPSTSFIEADRGDVIIFNYIVSFPESFGTFTGDQENDRRVGILRECRGLTFCAKTGKVLARKFHKFRNVNETEESRIDRIDWTRSHRVLTKLDGSMITPVLAGDLQWHTKMGATEIGQMAANFVSERRVYRDFAYQLCESGFTPNFEFTSRKNRVVIDYREDGLTLLAVRDNHTGDYLGYDELLKLGEDFGVPVVSALSSGVGDINAFIEATRALENAEGYVVAFDNGERYKVKADDYVRVHKAKDAMTLEKSIVSVIVNDQVDDFLAILPDADKDALNEFNTLIETGLMARAREIEEIVAAAKQQQDMDKKTFAMTVAPQHPGIKSFLFSVFDGKDAFSVLKDHVRKNIGSQPKVDEVRHLWGGARWSYGVVTGD